MDNDFEHYYNATIKLKAEVAEIKAHYEAEIREIIDRIEGYDGSYIDKRFWNSRFWRAFKDKE